MGLRKEKLRKSKWKSRVFSPHPSSGNCFAFPNVLISFERKHDKRGNCCSRKSRIQTCGIVHKDKIEVSTKVFCYHICDRNTCTSIILPAKYNQPMIYALDKAPIHHIRAPTLGYLHFVKKNASGRSVRAGIQGLLALKVLLEDL